jgi:hypothetical protein
LTELAVVPLLSWNVPVRLIEATSCQESVPEEVNVRLPKLVKPDSPRLTPLPVPTKVTLPALTAGIVTVSPPWATRVPLLVKLALAVRFNPAVVQIADDWIVIPLTEKTAVWVGCVPPEGMVT